MEKTPKNPTPVRRWWTATLLLCAGLAIFYWSGREPDQPIASPSAVPVETEGSSLPQTLASAEPAEAKISDPRAAHLTFAGQQRVVVPNPRGEFPRVSVPASTVVAATVPFPNARPGETVRVQSEDGGTLQVPSGDGMAMVDSNRQVPVEFQVSDVDGIQRITLHRGSERRVLEFWVGPEAPVLVRR